MKKHFRYYFLLVLSVTFLLACKKQAPAPDFHYDYFGLEQGRYIIYDVTEITHDDAIAVHDTAYYQLKTYWADTFIDNSGRIAREYWRYTRSTDQYPWVLQDVWTGIIDGTHGELVEENQRKIKMVFAPTLLKSWDANAYNMSDELDCFYRDIHKDTVVGPTSFDSTLVVEQASSYSLIDTVRKYEVYANNVGMIYKHYRDIHFQFNNGALFLDVGTEKYYSFVSTGFE